MATAPDDFRWRPILLPAYGPTAMASLGYGALAPIVALAASELGANVATAALVVGLTAFGQLVGDLPAGVIAAKLGERKALLLASMLDAASMTVAYFAHSLPVLAIAVFVDGLAASVFNLARHTWMTVAIPLRYRARALSSLGGTFRVGLFFGPFIAAGLISAFSAAGQGAGRNGHQGPLAGAGHPRRRGVADLGSAGVAGEHPAAVVAGPAP